LFCSQQGENEVKHKINYFIDAAMLVAFALCGITGIVKLPELGIAVDMNLYTGLSVIHDWSGVAAAALALAHLALHARWLATMTGRIFGRRREPKAVPAMAAASKRGVGALVLSAMVIAQSGQLAWARGGHGSQATIPQGIDYPAGTLKDGVYEGAAVGYQPSLTVRVEVKAGRIALVTVTRNNETPRWWSAVVGVIPSRIVKAQSTDVDAVSGATSSSFGIMSAVEEALKKAASAQAGGA
jgi:uncharacterized protein with FMN-binding domain